MLKGRLHALNTQKVGQTPLSGLDDKEATGGQLERAPSTGACLSGEWSLGW